MKIGIVTTWFERGAAYVSKQYVDALSAGNEVYVYARGGEKLAIDDKNWNTKNITWGDKKWGKDFSDESRNKNLEHFRKWIKETEPDVVFFNEEHWWESIMLCNDLGIKTGAYVDYYTNETNPFFIIYDFLICNTKRHMEAFKWHPQAFYIPWGTDIKLFKPISYELATKGIVTFFHSAGMNPLRKGTDILIRAFAKLKCKNTKLIIHSQKPLKEFFPKLNGIIKKLEDEEKLLCIEKTVGAPGLYYMGDVYVYPTILEGIGLTIAEALSSGLPVITSDNAPMNEFVNDEVGKLIKIRKFYKRDDDYYWPMCEPDESGLIAAMRYYCDNVTNLPTLKKKAREFAETYLDWRKNSINISEIFSGAKIVSSTQKEDVRKVVIEYEKIKKSKIRRFFHKIKILKWQFIPYLFKFITDSLSGILWKRK